MRGSSTSRTHRPARLLNSDADDGSSVAPRPARTSPIAVAMNATS